MPLSSIPATTLTVLALGLLTFLIKQFVFPLYKRRAAIGHIAGPPCDNIWTGNWHQLFHKNAWQFKKSIQETYGGVLKINALFGDQQLYITDPLAITAIFQADRPSYETNAYHLLRSRLSFGYGLVGTTGAKHLKQRRLMAPYFASKYLRTLLPVFYPFAYELCDDIEKKIKKYDGVINMHRMMSIAALEYVGTGLGYRFDGLNESKPNEYNDAAKALNPLTFKLSTYRAFLPYWVQLGPAWFRKRLVDWVPWPDLHRVKAVIYRMDDIAQDILQTRKQAFADGESYGRDILSAIMRYNDEAEDDEKIDKDEIISHITTTLFAGHETTAGVLSRIIHQLSLHHDAQERLREEVTKAREAKGDLEFEDLLELPYLDAICKETLRVYPPVDQLYRTSVKPTVIPILYPIQSTDGKELREIAIEPGTDTIVSIVGYNRNKSVWGADAEEWIPERWLEPLRTSVLQAKLPAVFSHMMTFTLGERACIGYKFAEMEMKLILSVLLSRFRFSIDPKNEIFWNMGGSITPIVKDSGQIEPTLPIRVSVLPKATA